MIIILWIVAIVIIVVSMIAIGKNGRKCIYNLYFSNGMVKPVPVILSVGILHFLMSIILFGILFALGDSGERSGFIVIVFSTLNYILHFFSGFITLLFNNVFKIELPDVVNLVLSFLVDALIWAIAVFWIIKKYVKVKISVPS